MKVFIGILILAFFNEASCAGDKAVDPDYLRKVYSSATEHDREAALADNSPYNWVFDYYNAKVGATNTSGGRLVSGNVSISLLVYKKFVNLMKK